jgi:hypothetical protein
MTKKLWRLGMLALFGWCAQSSTVGAQTPAYVEVQPVSFTPTNTSPGAFSYSDSYGPAVASERNRPLQRMCDAYVERLGCAADFNNPGCGSCYSHLLFMFGSCRTFFGPICEPAPAPGFFGFGYHGGAAGAGSCQGCGY